MNLTMHYPSMDESPQAKPARLFKTSPQARPARLLLGFLLTCSPFAGETVIAEEYSYGMEWSAPRYSSAFSACNSWVGYHGFLKVLRVTRNLDDPRYGCEFLYDYMYGVNPGRPENFKPNWARYVVSRYGDSCPAGTINNIDLAECTSISLFQQKGNPRGKPGTNAPASCTGNPINFAIGNKFQQESDYQGGNTSSLHFVRSYNSLDGLWRHSYSTHLRIDASTIALVQADGRESYFSVQSGSAVTTSPELGRLVQEAGQWVYLSSSNERFSFDTQGRLTRWEEPTGQEQTLSYEGNRVTVTDSFGRSLGFTADDQRQPLSLTVDGLQITYSYDVYHRLTQLTRTRAGQSEQRTFHYEDARDTKLLTGITDEQGIRFATWAYDDQGRAISSEHAGGTEKVLVSYNADGSSTVTNELGKQATYRFQTIEGVRRITAIEGEPSPNCPSSNSTYAYNARGQVERKTDNKGHVTTYSYNERGQEISRTEATGTPQARTITTEWHPSLALPLTVTEPGRITRFQYDDEGRPLGQSVEAH